MSRNQYNLQVSDDFSPLETIIELLKLGVKNKVEMIELPPIGQLEPLQAICYSSLGQRKVRFIPAQRLSSLGIRTQIKGLAGIKTSSRSPKVGQFTNIQIKNSEGRDVVVTVITIPSEHGEFIILFFT